MNHRAAVLNTLEFPLDPKQIQVAVQKASSFDEKVRDVRDLMSFEERAISSIPNLRRHKLRRTSLISKANWSIVPYDESDQNSVLLASEASKRLSSVIAKYSRYYVEGELYGVSLQQLLWVPSDYGLKPTIVKSFRPYQLERNKVYRNQLAVLIGTGNGQFQRSEIPENEIQNYLAFAADNPEPGGILRTIIYACYMINLSRQEYSQFIQFLKGIIQAKVKLGATPQDKEAAMKAVKETVKNKAAVTTDLVEFVWERMNNENAGKAFDAFLQLCYDEIEIAITNVAMMGTDRDRVAFTVLERGENDLAHQIRTDFTEIINEQLLVHDYYMNVDKSIYGIEPPYKFEFNIEKQEDKVANANILLEAINSGLQVTVRTWNEKTGIELANDPDEIITTSLANNLSDALNNETES